ncbi:MAG: sugar phosphate isomerase/epimerase [Acidimicrobiia bacterium]
MSWNQCLDEIRDVGYEWIELGPYGYLPTDVGQLRTELEKRSLRVSATFAMGPLDSQEYWPTLKSEVIGACESLSAVGAGHLIVIDGTYSDLFTGEMLRSPTLDDSGWARMIDTTHRIARIASERYGLRAVFHPHVETHVEYEDQIERFLDDTDPDLIGLCLDTGHHAYRGGDPVEFVRANFDRIEYFHLKSVDADVREKVEREHIPFARAVELDVFCEPTQGVVDFVALASVLLDRGFSGHATVEQDMYPAPLGKPLPAATRTYRFLRELGLGS